MLSLTLDFNFFKQIFDYARSEIFILSQKAFYIIFYLITNIKVDSEIIINFLTLNKETISNLIIETVSKQINEVKSLNSEKLNSYFIIRESLLVLEKLISNERYSKFSEFFTNNVPGLKMTMNGLNHPNMKIQIQALYILYYFLSDLESKDLKIKKILLANKANFEKYFNLKDSFYDESCQEKKNYILYEMERLENIIND